LDCVAKGGQLAERASPRAKAIAPLEFLAMAEMNLRAVAFAPRGATVGLSPHTLVHRR